VVRYTDARVAEEPAAFIRGKYNYKSGKAVFESLDLSLLLSAARISKFSDSSFM